MHIDFTKCPYVTTLLRKGFSLEQAMMLYRYERLGTKVRVLHYKQFSVEQLEYLCKVMQKAKYLSQIPSESINSLGVLSNELDKITDFPKV